MQTGPLHIPAMMYHPEGFSTDKERLMGRHAAGESLLRAWAQYSPDRSVCYALTEPIARHYAKRVREFSGNSAQQIDWVRPGDFDGLRQAGALLLAGPNLAEFAYQRRYTQESAYSLCGLTHTTASTTAMDSIAALLTAPTHPWDALICTSHSVKTMVTTALDEYERYLAERLQVPRLKCPVQLPVIPLGLDAKRFKPTPERREAGKALRNSFDISDETVVFLFMGRLSFHAKAHPYPMMLALEAAAQRTGKPLVLILAGWYSNSSIQQEFQEAAKRFCPSVRLLEVDGRQPQIRETIWYAADVFTSLSDNVQETFGLTPIEAKAAGLPVVVSDWDGYRETVNHGVDGFCIPTTMPDARSGALFAFQLESHLDDYDHYIGKVSQSVAVDIAACSDIYTELVQNPAVRRQLGEAGLADVARRYDWPVIMDSYQALCSELADLRAQAEPLVLRPAIPNPLRADPYHLFASYPTHVFTPESRFQMNDRTRLRFVADMSMLRLAQAEIFSAASIENLLDAITLVPEGLLLTALQSSLPTDQFARLQRTLGWLLKLGVLAHTPS